MSMKSFQQRKFPELRQNIKAYIHTLVSNLLCYVLFQESESSLVRNPAQLPQRNGSNGTNNGEIELHAMAGTIGRQEQDDPQSRSGQLPEILVRGSPENERAVARQQSSEQQPTSEDRGGALPENVPSTNASVYRGLHHNGEPTHSFFRTVSNFYRRKK